MTMTQTYIVMEEQKTYVTNLTCHGRIENL